MGYVRHSLPSYSSYARRKAYVESPVGGVCLSADENGLGDTQSPECVNMRINNGVLRTRFGQKSVFSEARISGTLHSITKQPFYSRTLFHIKNKLYSMTNDSAEPEELYSLLPDEKSVFVQFSSKLYIYCACRVFSVGKDFEVKEEEPYAPLIYTDVNPSLPYNGKRTAEKLNLLSPKITVSYSKSTNSGYLLPFDCDVSRPVTVYNCGEEVQKTSYTLSEKRVLFNFAPNPEASNSISVSYYVKNASDIGFEDKLSGCTIGVSYGGTVVSGTRIFLSGNRSFPGVYFASSLLDPLRFDEDSFEVVGNISENITGMIRQYGHLIIFTENSVSRMTYSFSDSEPVFSVRELNGSVGCDVPDSIELIDNRVVFANSSRGVFIIDSTEDFGEQNIKPVSGNILCGKGMGFLDCKAQDRKSAFSIDFDRRYYLCAGKRVYVWDYNECAYSDSGNYAASQSRLVWYVYDGISADCFFELCGKLFTYDGTEGFAFFDDIAEDFGRPIESKFRTKPLELVYPYAKKSVTSVVFESGIPQSVNITAKFFHDGEEYYSGGIFAGKENAAYPRYSLRLPKGEMYRFAMELCASGGVFEIRSLCISFRVSKKDRM